MKILSKILFLFAFISAAGFLQELRAAPGSSCELRWQPSPSSGIAGYAVYYGVLGSAATNRIDTGSALSCKIAGLSPYTTLYFYVVVYDAFGNESPPSNLVLYTTPRISALQVSPASNGTVGIQLLASPGASCRIEYTPTLSPPVWTVLTNAVADSNGLVTIRDLIDPSQPSRFYRGQIGSGLTAVPASSAISGVGFMAQWQPALSPGISGYAVYYGATSSSMDNRLDAGSQLSANITGLLPATTYFYEVVAYDSSGDESAISGIQTYTTPPLSPLQISQASNGTVSIRFQASPGAACQVQYTATLNPPAWTALTNVVADSNGMVSVTDLVNGPQRFYRGAIGTGILPMLQAQLLPAPGCSYTLGWAPDLGLGVMGYVVTFAALGSSVKNQVDVGQALSTTISGLLPSATYVFSISSYDLIGVLNTPLDTVVYTTPPISPLEIAQSGNGAILEFRVSPGAACHVEYTATLNPPAWTVLTNTAGDANGMVMVTDPASAAQPIRFYRGSVP
jgi:hypothetical protein